MTAKKIQFNLEEFKEWLKEIEISSVDNRGDIHSIFYELDINDLIEIKCDQIRGTKKKMRLKGEIRERTD